MALLRDSVSKVKKKKPSKNQFQHIWLLEGLRKTCSSSEDLLVNEEHTVLRRAYWLLLISCSCISESLCWLTSIEHGPLHTTVSWAFTGLSWTSLHPCFSTGAVLNEGENSCLWIPHFCLLDLRGQAACNTILSKILGSLQCSLEGLWCQGFLLVLLYWFIIIYYETNC